MKLESRTGLAPGKYNPIVTQWRSATMPESADKFKEEHNE